MSDPTPRANAAAVVQIPEQGTTTINSEATELDALVAELGSWPAIERDALAAHVVADIMGRAAAAIITLRKSEDEHRLMLDQLQTAVETHRGFMASKPHLAADCLESMCGTVETLIGTYRQALSNTEGGV